MKNFKFDIEKYFKENVRTVDEMINLSQELAERTNSTITLAQSKQALFAAYERRLAMAEEGSDAETDLYVVMMIFKRLTLKHDYDTVRQQQERQRIKTK